MDLRFYNPICDSRNKLEATYRLLNDLLELVDWLTELKKKIVNNPYLLACRRAMEFSSYPKNPSRIFELAERSRRHDR